MTSERRLIKCLSPFLFFSTTTKTTAPATAPAPPCQLCFYAVHLYISSCHKALSHRVLAEHIMVLHQDRPLEYSLLTYI